MQADLNAPFAWFLWIWVCVCLCVCVCCKIWLLRQCRIDEHSSFTHTHTHTHTHHAHRHIHHFHSLAEWGVCGERDPPSPRLEDMKFLTVLLCVCVNMILRVYDLTLVCKCFCLILHVCVLPWDGGGYYVCVYICVYICFCVCVCVCVLCVRAHAWLSGLSQTAQNSLQSDISPAGDKWWLEERERWGLAGISVSLRWRHIYTHTH